ncbi:hypothetical protein NDU88_006324 [Pleurodeles waltl]|uniref:Uncharacterized protein n=1 Tax=Pleurodeles waltl TaxID=8319 RepID=A0AAV7TWK2_PLEWA|nr:hypothetical protein NDU88_006324 [Pleurodeles waltl]
MVELKAGFKAIHMLFDALTMCLDKMHKHMDDQCTRPGAAKQGSSGVEDGVMDMARGMERVEWLLKTLVAKNEDLEARSRSNNICITGMAESTNIRPMSTYVEHLLG